MAVEGIRVELVNGAPLGVIHFAAEARVEFNARLGDAASLAFRFLAFLGGKRRQESVKGLIAPVIPMELAVAPENQPRLVQRLAAVIAWKQNMPRGEPLGPCIFTCQPDQPG